MIELDLQDQAKSLLREVPPVLRARDFRLYIQGGGRLLDLWQYGGAAVLGHTPSGVLRELKNTAERGLFTPFPHPLENRFTKALSRLFPGKGFRVYAQETSLRHALATGGYTFQGAAPFPDPAIQRLDPAVPLSLWRPFLEDEPLPPSRLLIPVLPWALSPRVLVIPESLELPPSDMLSPVILAAGTRSLYDLIAAASERGKLRFPKIQQALRQSKWQRRGIYLHYGEPLDKESYRSLFLHFLEGGFLLPPCQDTPLIIPGILSPGEELRLAELLQEVW
jgi:hypothetical protein